MKFDRGWRSCRQTTGQRSVIVDIKLQKVVKRIVDEKGAILRAFYAVVESEGRAGFDTSWERNVL